MFARVVVNDRVVFSGSCEGLTFAFMWETRSWGGRVVGAASQLLLRKPKPSGGASQAFLALKQGAEVQTVWLGRGDRVEFDFGGEDESPSAGG